MFPITAKSLISFFTVSVLILTSAASAKAGDWNAVVWSPTTGKAAFSKGDTSAEAAIASAMNKAGNPSKWVRLHVKNGYAVIVSDNTGHHGTGIGDNYANALRNALQFCPGGTVRIWVGSTAR